MANIRENGACVVGCHLLNCRVKRAERGLSGRLRKGVFATLNFTRFLLSSVLHGKLLYDISATCVLCPLRVPPHQVFQQCSTLGLAQLESESFQQAPPERWWRKGSFTASVGGIKNSMERWRAALLVRQPTDFLRNTRHNRVCF